MNLSSEFIRRYKDDELLVNFLREQEQKLDKLRQLVADLNHDRDEDRAELRRHHDDFRMVSGLAADAEHVIRECSDPLDASDTLDDLHSLVRSIRNIVG